MKYTFHFLVLLALFLPSSLSAQQPVVHNYVRTDYHGGKQNWSIDMTVSGIMLFANDDGLLTFDSQEWRTYP